MPYRFETNQLLAASVDDVWDFWATIEGFAALQPPENQFSVTENTGANELSQGQEVGYRLRLAPMLWTSGRQRFVEVEPKTRFTDEQLEGTWKTFRHQHLLEEIEGGVEIRNVVDYSLPLEPLSRPLHRLMIVPSLARIARWERQVFADRFGELGDRSWSAHTARLCRQVVVGTHGSVVSVSSPTRKMR